MHIKCISLQNGRFSTYIGCTTEALQADQYFNMPFKIGNVYCLLSLVNCNIKNQLFIIPTFLKHFITPLFIQKLHLTSYDMTKQHYLQQQHLILNVWYKEGPRTHLQLIDCDSTTSGKTPTVREETTATQFLVPTSLLGRTVHIQIMSEMCTITHMASGGKILRSVACNDTF